MKGVFAIRPVNEKVKICYDYYGYHKRVMKKIH